jgi:hypothetical protein
MKSCILSYEKQGLSRSWDGPVHNSEVYKQLFNLCYALRACGGGGSS